ncbi:hypothetical protein BDR22DRAFT_826612 [Usnea florida]
MSASSLPALPVEIITEIFKSTDDFSTATALGGTCRGLHSVWKSNAASICYALLVRTIPCYDQAFQYVQVQQLDAVSSGLFDGTDVLAIGATKQFLQNADDAHLALQLYEIQLSREYSGVHRTMPVYQRLLVILTEAQRGSFLKAWYRLHTLASLPSDPLLYSILASLDRLEFEQMRDVVRWLWIELPSKRITRHEPRIRHSDLIGGEESGALVKSHITGKQWHELEGRLNSLFKEELCRDVAFWYFICHEFYWGNEESWKGNSLADKLPPMDNQDISHQFVESFHEFISRGANQRNNVSVISPSARRRLSSMTVPATIVSCMASPLTKVIPLDQLQKKALFSYLIFLLGPCREAALSARAVATAEPNKRTGELSHPSTPEQCTGPGEIS